MPDFYVLGHFVAPRVDMQIERALNCFVQTQKRDEI